MRPVLCMVTDRSRLGQAWPDALVERVGAAARAGVHLVQIRERDLETRSLSVLVARCCDAVRGTAARVLVNDRVDVAIATGASGVHLRSDSVTARRMRSLVPRPFMLGRSVHALDEGTAVAADGALDYLLYGTVFATPSKSLAVPRGPEALAHLVAATPVPVLAIGGITLERIAAVASTGAAGFAAIGLFAECPVADLGRTVDRINELFDTTSAVS